MAAMAVLSPFAKPEADSTARADTVSEARLSGFLRLERRRILFF
jgi:hypothetical protein